MNRPPALAGLFYPASPSALNETLDECFTGAVRSGAASRPKAIIGPHAGVKYSGPIMASACVRLSVWRDSYRRVVMAGPSHRIAFDGIALCSAEVFETPFGNVPVDLEAKRRLLELDFVHVLDAAHSPEHSLEVHLPFLQRTLSDFRIVPMIVGEATDEEIARALELFWEDEGTLIDVSSDLSHFLSYDRARASDSATAAAIEALDSKPIGVRQACGYQPIGGLLRAARAHGLKAETLDLRNSGDTAGPRDEVVGYGAFAFV